MNTAVKEFQTAAQLDPHFFEAQMNLAAINLSFRGFDKAEAAYRKALEMHPNDYDAHLGLALALRGQIDDSNYDKQVAAVQAELDACKKIDARAARRLLQRGHPDAGVQGQGRRRHGQGRRRLPAGQDDLPDLHRQGVGQAGVRRRASRRRKERMQDIDDTDHLLAGRRSEHPGSRRAAPHRATPRLRPRPQRGWRAAPVGGAVRRRRRLLRSGSRGALRHPAT